MTQIHSTIKPHGVILVMDGSIGQMAGDQAAAFQKMVNINGVIMTKLDYQNSKGGGKVSLSLSYLVDSN